ncbi:hypothetical protein OUZ56_028267 [Daphnia magna]|uniref:Uncharacterized protein n=1 Tax=Daphnia magna TaxID=35525 RepID=A0ABR0B3B8_9CRUS|nr:hypothetical protein OUZ56_028267 [Daphnia magna]
MVERNTFEISVHYRRQSRTHKDQVRSLTWISNDDDYIVPCQIPLPLLSDGDYRSSKISKTDTLSSMNEHWNADVADKDLREEV